MTSINLSRGASIRATRSSKYALSPSRKKMLREGRTARVSEGSWLCSERKAWGWNEMERSLSVGNMARHVTKSAGEMYPVCGMLLSPSLTMLLPEERNVDIFGMGMPWKVTSRSDGKDPPVNPPGRTGISVSIEKSEKRNSAGNDC